MSDLPKGILQREFEKFRLLPNGGVAVKTIAVQGDNPLMDLVYDGNGNLTTLTKTLDGATYTKTFTWNNGNLTTVSTWI